MYIIYRYCKTSVAMHTHTHTFIDLYSHAVYEDQGSVILRLHESIQLPLTSSFLSSSPKLPKDKKLIIVHRYF